jgi:enoyl-CoA hydratase/carnithine racemase
VSEPVNSKSFGEEAVVELDRPERRNAMDTTLLRALIENLKAIAGSSNSRAVVITGKGGAFSAGADVSEAVTEEQAIERMRLFASVLKFQG